jgi:hypothetical protein
MDDAPRLISVPQRVKNILFLECDPSSRQSIAVHRVVHDYLLTRCQVMLPGVFVLFAYEITVPVGFSVLRTENRKKELARGSVYPGFWPAG